MTHPNVAVVNKMWDCLKALVGYGDGTESDSSYAQSLQALHNEVFTPDLTYYMPGHHPIAGVKHGIDEVLAFFGKMVEKSGLLQDDQSIHAFGEDGAVEVHRAHGGNGKAYLDIINCFVFQLRDGKIAEIRVFNNNQQAVDNFFSTIYSFKPIPERLAD
ncbi:hypothetical protein NUACC21_80650 [Scytonema sp. NUACC21]